MNLKLFVQSTDAVLVVEPYEWVIESLIQPTVNQHPPYWESQLKMTN